MKNNLLELEQNIDSLINLTYNMIGQSDIPELFDLLLNIIMCKLSIINIKKEENNIINNLLSFMIEFETAKNSISNAQQKALEYLKDHKNNDVYDIVGKLYKYKEGLTKIEEKIK